jgi:hypothetical protein
MLESNNRSIKAIDKEIDTGEQRAIVQGADEVTYRGRPKKATR